MIIDENSFFNSEEFVKYTLDKLPKLKKLEIFKDSNIPDKGDMKVFGYLSRADSIKKFSTNIQMN